MEPSTPLEHITSSLLSRLKEHYDQLQRHKRNPELNLLVHDAQIEFKIWEYQHKVRNGTATLGDKLNNFGFGLCGVDFDGSEVIKRKVQELEKYCVPKNPLLMVNAYLSNHLARSTYGGAHEYSHQLEVTWGLGRLNALLDYDVGNGTIILPMEAHAVKLAVASTHNPNAIKLYQWRKKPGALIVQGNQLKNPNPSEGKPLGTWFYVGEDIFSEQKDEHQYGFTNKDYGEAMAVLESDKL